MRRPSMSGPALVVGAPSALLASLPALCGGGCFCAAALLFGGLAAAALYRRSCEAAGVAFTPREGTLIGLWTGLVHLGVLFVLSLVLYLFGAALAALIPVEELIDSATRRADFEYRELLEPLGRWTLNGILGAGLGGALALVEGLCLGVIVIPFHVGSGLLGGALFPYDPPSAPSLVAKT